MMGINVLFKTDNVTAALSSFHHLLFPSKIIILRNKSKLVFLNTIKKNKFRWSDDIKVLTKKLAFIF